MRREIYHGLTRNKRQFKCTPWTILELTFHYNSNDII